MKTVPEVLDAAADQIETRGWLQGQLLGPNDDGRRGLEKLSCCLMGGIAVHSGVLTGEQGSTLLELAAGTAAKEELRRRRWPAGAVTWNDTPGRTAAEVIDVLRSAAKYERSKQQ